MREFWLKGNRRSRNECRALDAASRCLASLGMTILEAAHDGTGTFDGGIGALHGFDGDAGGFGDDDRLADVVVCDVAGDVAPVGDVLLFSFGRSALGQYPGFREQRL